MAPYACRVTKEKLATERKEKANAEREVEKRHDNDQRERDGQVEDGFPVPIPAIIKI